MSRLPSGATPAATAAAAAGYFCNTHATVPSTQLISVFSMAHNLSLPEFYQLNPAMAGAEVVQKGFKACVDAPGVGPGGFKCGKSEKTRADIQCRFLLQKFGISQSYLFGINPRLKKNLK